MNAFLALPLEVRLLLAFALGANGGWIVAVWAQRLAAGLALPTAAKFDSAGQRQWLRRSIAATVMGCTSAGLYYWEVASGSLLPPLRMIIPPVGFVGESDIRMMLHVQFAAHIVLFLFMFAASWVDVRERIVPDSITVPGTIVGAALAAIYPWMHLTGDLVTAPSNLLLADFVKVTSPIAMPWPALLSGAPSPVGLAIGLGCFVLWFVGLLHRPWRLRRGWRVALQLLVVRMAQSLWVGRRVKPMMALLTGGITGIALTWFIGGAHWIALMSSLVGVAAAGGLVWAVRQVCFLALGREAMGFGDVTLIAMIGAFLGWQAGVIVFFIAPVLALGWALFQLLRTGDHELFFGPFLCLAAAVVVFAWSEVWQRVWGMFSLGWLVPLFLGIALFLMALMLAGLRWLRGN